MLTKKVSNFTRPCKSCSFRRSLDSTSHKCDGASIRGDRWQLSSSLSTAGQGGGDGHKVSASCVCRAFRLVVAWLRCCVIQQAFRSKASFMVTFALRRPLLDNLQVQRTAPAYLVLAGWPHVPITLFLRVSYLRRCISCSFELWLACSRTERLPEIGSHSSSSPVTSHEQTQLTIANIVDTSAGTHVFSARVAPLRTRRHRGRPTSMRAIQPFEWNPRCRSRLEGIIH